LTTVDARLARLEEQIKGVREDVAEMHNEVERARTRLHNLEGITQMFVDAQKLNRRREEEQYRRLGNVVGIGGLALSFAMLVLAAVTLYVHHG
jgi:predicted  nucleic acid-binding Zn-ribbon protein